MSFYFSKIPSIIPLLYPQRIWRINTGEKNIYLTFDDGPHPYLTPKILDVLSKFQAKVTFFQLGSKVLDYPALHERCIVEGHIVGNHGYYHLDACVTNGLDFVKNINKGREIIGSSLYRPAYGRLPVLIKSKILKDNKVVMWDVMPGDFDESVSAEKCINNIKKNARNGSIIVLHENEKSKDKVVNVLDPILCHFSNLGFRFRGIPE